MNKVSGALILSLFLTVIFAFSPKQNPKDPAVYSVKKLKQPMKIDADWNKSQWKKVKEIAITNYMGKVPDFQPVAKAKMMYDDGNLYLIFHVDDRYVRLQTSSFNGKVFEDACVEFFFSPDSNLPLSYFNLEMNAGGKALMEYHHDSKTTRLTAEDFEKVEIAHSMPEKLDHEITEPVTWTVEYRLPLAMLKKFSNVSQPAKGTVWKANFFKTSSKNSNPHYITWSFVDNKTPQFHLPQYFGTLNFK